MLLDQKSSSSIYDVIVIGGGPAGSTVANLLAHAGKRVLLFEKASFPRFHIGESLLPYNHSIFEELGVLEELNSDAFVSKVGAQIGLWNGNKVTKFVFTNSPFTEFTSSWQVQRSHFDQVLLKQAASRGADVCENCEIMAWTILPENVSVKTRGGDTYTARYLVDASGTNNFTGNREKLKTLNPHLQKIAVFTHFSGVPELPGSEAGDTLIFRHPQAWFWAIPLGNQKCSVGVVFDKSLLKKTKLSPEELFQTFVNESPALKVRLQDAEPTMPLRTIVDFSYTNKRLVSERLIRIGDAAGFVDPIFSSGVYLAMFMGKAAAQALLKTLEKNNPPLSSEMLAYEKSVRRNIKIFHDLIVDFYRPEFFDLLLYTESKSKIPSALNALFAGRLDQTWPVRWRIQAFRLLVRIQKYFPLVERLGLEQAKN
ncbi:MAG: NAD(P)/FAD-dependent oxidoreductase [Chthoniobacterales bacterium]